MNWWGSESDSEELTGDLTGLENASMARNCPGDLELKRMLTFKHRIRLLPLPFLSFSLSLSIPVYPLKYNICFFGFLCNIYIFLKRVSPQSLLNISNLSLL